MCQWHDLFLPASPEFGEAMQQDDQFAILWASRDGMQT
jgi:hypothetical protein